MPKPVVVDTDVLVDFFRGYSKAVDLVNAHVAQIILSPIVVAELYAMAREGSEQEALGNFISLFRVAPVTAEIAKAACLYKREYGKSHGVRLADAIVAATADAERAELKTLNVKHYPMLKNPRSAYKK